MGIANTISPVFNKDPKLSPKQVQKYIDGIYDGSITEYDLPLDVYEAITDYLKAGLYKGYGMTLEEAEGADLALLSELRENVYMFGAAKTYQMTKEISSLLVGEDGELRTAKEFNQVARETYSNWNDNWGATEYQTAVASASSAAKWRDVEEQADVLPNLRYSAIMDANTSEICAPLNGIVAPIDDPIWSTITPPNHFNCRCVILQEGPEAKLTPDSEKGDAFDKVDGEMDDMFKQNPGKTGSIFDKDHPYFDVPKADRDFAKDNFDMPIPPNDNPAQAGAIQSTMQEQEEEAIRDFTGSWAYGKVSNYLRNGVEGEYAEEVKRLTNHIDNYLKKADKFQGTSYRGLQFKKRDAGYKELIKTIKAKGEIFDKSFMSTTSDEDVLRYFLDKPIDSIKFEIEGKSGVDIDHLSRNKGEKEILFPRNTKFKVVSYEEKDYGSTKYYNVKLKEI